MTVLLCLPIKVRNDDAGERADCRELGRPELVSAGKRGEGSHRFVSGRQNESEGAEPAVFIEQSCLHTAAVCTST
jgi:hypothetical protein